MNRAAFDRTDTKIAIAVALLIGFGYFTAGQRHYIDYLDYTLQIAGAFLNGHLGVSSAPAWLNEMVPYRGLYYSVFPLGAVLCMLPFKLLAAWIGPQPAPLVLLLLTAATTLLGHGLTSLRPDMTLTKRLLLAAWIPLATWYLPNMLFGGAWQLALGFAAVGELGALYFSLVKRRPWLAGLFFAVGFGNRTEILLTAPIIIYFLLRPKLHQQSWLVAIRKYWRDIFNFGLIPSLLLVATAAYNWVRFGSVSDFGYARIPGVLQEPWYQHGIFSLQAIPDNASTMLWHGGPRFINHWPFVLTDPFGSSILIACPFLLLMLWRWRQHVERHLLWPAAAAVVVLTFLLWIHGNTGGWQFSYRYAIVLMPWLLLMFIERLPGSITTVEKYLWWASVAINVFATYLFLWSGALGY